MAEDIDLIAAERHVGAQHNARLLAVRLINARHWRSEGAVMTRASSPRTTPSAAWFFRCEADDRVLDCAH